MLALQTAPGTDVRLASPTAADLVRTTELAPGLTVEIDLADPSRWHAVEVRDWAAADPALLNSVLGRPAVRLLSSGMPHIGEPIDVVPAPAWRRLAVLDALDWWLQLPLNQGLLDAERAIARARAAASLPAGLLRHSLVDRAVVHARRSADDVTLYLNGLGDSSLPRALFSGLARLATGYAALRQEVDGPDAALSAVLTAWNRVKSTDPVGHPSTFELDDVRLAASGPAVDPRQLRARIAGDVQLTPDPYGTSVRVVVPAFVPMPSALVADRVMVRLVDQRSGEAQEPMLLTLRSGAFTETVPLHGTPVEYVRADVFDPDSAVQPAQPADLVRARRAQLVLSEWRRAVAESRLSRSVRVRNRRMVRLADVPSEEPLFYGGPSTVDIARLIKGRGEHAWFRSTSRAGEPLVAELAAVYDAAAAS
ncbi:hypothetical protein [Kribbella sp. NPDC048928]|uniref:hypothetical protein n=1 Tax=Kribbella sp. NPDC048928 TaxID=3364111 RepID=UPI00371CF090